MNDLVDYTKLEVNRLRRAQSRIQKKFAPQAASQEEQVIYEEPVVLEEAYPQEDLNFSKS